MYVIFNRKHYALLRWRLIFYIIFALFIMVSDVKFKIFFKIHHYINYSSLFLHHLNEGCKQQIKSFICSLKNNKQLILKNQQLQEKLFMINTELLLTEYYKQENDKLRALLFSPSFFYKKKILAQVISNKINPYVSQIVINKGTNHGVNIGQAVVNEQGVIGQVIATNKITSQVLLICDMSHALPVQILRNNTRMILQGNGYNNYLELKNSSNNNNVKVGDILITSGLDGRFPKGYPVAIVASIITDHKKTTISDIKASSIAKLNHLSYLLLLENVENNKY